MKSKLGGALQSPRSLLRLLSGNIAEIHRHVLHAELPTRVGREHHLLNPGAPALDLDESGSQGHQGDHFAAPKRGTIKREDDELTSRLGIIRGLARQLPTRLHDRVAARIPEELREPGEKILTRLHVSPVMLWACARESVDVRLG